MKYSKVFIMFAFAVSTRLYRMALAFAPLEDSIITKFLRPMVKGRHNLALKLCNLNYKWSEGV
ncbi:hypothetical protein [Blautia obeum]|uniref:hypothetical protein n=1 Tax=Blautia obeum TaxID=40520 RepID=UPI001FA9B1B1|nr:hypothetical protein [Blautia obeum]